MTSLKQRLAIVASVLLVAGCTSGNSRIQPPFQSVNPLAYTLEFAVGTANYQVFDQNAGAVIPVTGLNTVETYRQPNGLSATLVNSPTIIGPSGFLVPAASVLAGVDAGTAMITSTPQTVQPGSSTPATTFGQAGGVFAYGFLPVNSTNNALAGNTGFAPYSQPFYTDGFSSDGSDLSLVYLGGPPAYTNVQTGTYPSGFLGFTHGFNSFGSKIATGSYTLNVVVPTSPTASGTLTAQATLKTTALLPVNAGPSTVTEDGTGGAALSIPVPAGVRETIVDVVDLGQDSTSTFTDCHTGYSAPYYYTIVDHTTGPAAANVTLPANVGPIPAAGGAAEPTLCAGDDYYVAVIGTDYPAYEAGPGQPDPNGISAAPTLAGATGQSDITVSAPATTTSGIYGMSTARKPQSTRPFTRLPHHRVALRTRVLGGTGEFPRR
jgi:hypothetical protein